MKNTIQLILIFAVVLLAACDSKKKTKDGFTILDNGLEIKMNEDKSGPTADSGFISKIHISFKVGDSLIFNSKNTPTGDPVNQPISPPKVLADLMLGFMQMSKGDKATMRIVADSLFQPGQPKPPFVKDGDLVTWEVEMVDLLSPEDMEKEKKELAEKETKTLEAYVKEKGLNAKKTASGMYMEVTKEGTGELVGSGRQATMKYTGYLLDGTKFDSNVDPLFEHVKPFEFVVGQGMVIPGWDEGIAALKVGSKAKLLIPSGMAYGPQARPGNDKNPKGIPANSPLMFEVEVLGVKDAPKPPSQPPVNPDGTAK